MTAELPFGRRYESPLKLSDTAEPQSPDCSSSVHRLPCGSLFPMFFGLLLAAAAVLPTPCASATSNCTEWIEPSGKPSRVLVYRTYPLETKNEDITRAFVFVHGILRDADNHFRTALAAAFLADALNDTIIVAPRFASNSSTPGNETGGCGDPLIEIA